MVAKLWDPGKPTFYLDHSTLCSAFRAHVMAGPTPSAPVYRALMPWIQRVATEANLCLSVHHIAELSRWPDEATADAMGIWLEALPTTWMASLVDSETAEFDYWTKVAMGIAPSAPVNPYAPSLLTAFHDLELSSVVALLSSSSPFLALLRAGRAKGWETEVKFAPGISQVIRENRAWAAKEGWSAERRSADLAYKLRVHLRTMAGQAMQRMRNARDVDCRTAGENSEANPEDGLVAEYEGNPRALPMMRVRRRFEEGIINTAMARSGPSNKEAKDLAGSFHDMAHVSVGAAYCAVFTCDAAVDSWLGDVRPSLGLSRQLSIGGAGGDEVFVRALMATWPASGDRSGE